MNALLAHQRTQATDYSGLPLPVRMRACGVLDAWQRVVDELPGIRSARLALSDPAVPFVSAHDGTVHSVRPYMKKHSDQQCNNALLDVTPWLAHWWRGGSLYEPTPALTSLLRETDWSQDLPMRYFRTPVPAMCVLPPLGEPHLCGTLDAIQVFSHGVEAVDAPAHRAITVVAHQEVSTPHPGVVSLTLMLRVQDEDEPLSAVLERTIEEVCREPDGTVNEEAAAVLRPINRELLDYVVKVLLYLGLDDAEVTQKRPYSEAPRQFSGLGRRKREERQREIEKLYDRYLLGPVALAGAGDLSDQPDAAPVDGRSAVSTHWRRGHFRLQPHGPQASLRKVMFIAPTIVRADRMPGD
ncbi:hypothetical protein [Caldimonas brevitalea]|uniref:Uncharacterized protein n=1 Tax=Caldimonas brevitalea TaxID=413882 RepID=A0A0G3BSH0_9BURK|nr:hypothetical protein [Caldimonas brevitalea]AKJ30326.1 hypothetical protein AAW51_3635 [Caldimonas brevitalea]